MNVPPLGSQYMDPLISLLPVDAVQGPLEFFTTNYDLALEALFSRHRVTHSDGMAPRWDPNQLESPISKVLVRRLHGACHWFREQDGSVVASPVLVVSPSGEGTESWATISGQTATPFIMYPGDKLAFNAPSVWNLLALTARTSEPGFRVLVSCGSSLIDPHLLDALHEGARRNSNWLLLYCTDNPLDAQVRLESKGEGPSPLAGRVVYLKSDLRTPAGWNRVLEVALRHVSQLAGERAGEAGTGFSLGESTNWNALRNYLVGAAQLWPQEVALRLGGLSEFDPRFWRAEERLSWKTLEPLLIALSAPTLPDSTRESLLDLVWLATLRMADLSLAVEEDGGIAQVVPNEEIAEIGNSLDGALRRGLREIAVWHEPVADLHELAEVVATRRISRLRDLVQSCCPELVQKHWPDGEIPNGVDQTGLAEVLDAGLSELWMRRVGVLSTLVSDQQTTKD